jgi:hypothetical protein
VLGDVQLYSADDSVGNLVISEGFIHGVTNNSGDRVTGIFKQALLLEQLFMCGHKYFRVLLHCKMLGFFLDVISRASKLFIRAGSMQLKLRLAAIVAQRPIRVAVRQTAMIVAIIAASRPITLLRSILVLLVRHLHAKIIRIGGGG